MNLLTNMEDIADMIIRPSRYLYKLNDLGAKSFTLGCHLVTRTDFEVRNERNLIIRCSLFCKQPIDQCDDILLYLHCNSGCRIEGMAYLKQAIENEFAYLLFDFTGSGISEGKYISLGTVQSIQIVGYFEALDLQSVLKHVRQNLNRKARVILWGRSMGAVTALRYLAKFRNDVSLAVFDSPFQSLKELFLEIGKQKTNFPQILLNVAYKYLKPIITEKAQFDIDDVELESVLKDIKCKGIFIASKQDALIPFAQIQQIFNQYKAEKEMFFIDESHNEARNLGVIAKVFQTVKKNCFYMKQKTIDKSKDQYFSMVMVSTHEASKKKLELTIKSQSKRHLPSKEAIEVLQATHSRNQLSMPEKKSSSCLTTKIKCKGIEFKMPVPKSTKENSDAIQTNDSSAEIFTKRQFSAWSKLEGHIGNKSTACLGKENRSDAFLETKKQLQAPRNFFCEPAPPQHDHINDIKIKPKFTGEVKMISLKLHKDTTNRSRERKTFQNISSKRPPFGDVKEGRSSFELKTRV